MSTMCTEATNSPRINRLSASLIALASFSILAIATYLTPDPRGFGTHEQLGLPPCVSSNYLGVPCPLCGMTTAFSLMAHARPLVAFYAQPAGAIFFVVCVFAFASASATALLGFVPPHAAAIAHSRPLTVAAIVLLVAAWLYKLVVFLQ